MQRERREQAPKKERRRLDDFPVGSEVLVLRSDAGPCVCRVLEQRADGHIKLHPVGDNAQWVAVSEASLKPVASAGRGELEIAVRGTKPSVKQLHMEMNQEPKKFEATVKGMLPCDAAELLTQRVLGQEKWTLVHLAAANYPQHLDSVLDALGSETVLDGAPSTACHVHEST